MDGYAFRLDWDFWANQPNTLANRVKFLRLKQGESICKISKRVGVRKQTWIELENAKRMPRSRTLQLVAFALEKRPSTLLEGDLATFVELVRSKYDLEPPIAESR